jgi:hypothetical protein
MSSRRSVHEGDVDVDEVEVSGGQVSGGERSKSNEWNEWRRHGDLMSFKHVITKVFEGGLGPHHFWAHNFPQASTCPSNNTMVPIAGPL